MKRIKLLGKAKDLDDGFYEILTSGDSSYCLADEEYIVTNEVVKLLQGKGIKFIILK